MTRTLEEWKSETAALPPEDRAALAEYLLDSLVDDEADMDDAAWEEELNRRIAEIRSGKEVGIPAEEVMAKLRELYP